MKQILVVFLLLSQPALGQNVDPKLSRSEFDMKELREFINFGLSVTQARGSLRKLGEPTRTVRGRVVDHDGKPIVGVPVSFSSDIGYSFYSYDENFDITDEQGRFVLEGDFTRTRIIVWRGKQNAWHVFPDRAEENVEIRWPRPAKCSVTFNRSLLEDESLSNKVWLTTTHYAVGMSTLNRSIEISSDGPTQIDGLVPGEYSLQMERTVVLKGEPAEAKTFRVEVARFEAEAGDEKAVRASYAGRRFVSGKLELPKQLEKADKNKRRLTPVAPNSMFVEVREQKRSYEHVPQLLDASVTGKGLTFATRPLPPGRYVVSFVGPTPKTQRLGVERLGRWGQPTATKLKYRITVPEANAPLKIDFPPADSLEFQIQQALDFEGQMNVSYSYSDVQAAQIGRLPGGVDIILGMLRDKNTPNSWQYPLAKSLSQKAGDEGILREVIDIVSKTNDAKLRQMLVFQFLRNSKVLREEIADAVEPFRKHEHFRVRHMSYSTMGVHVTDKNRGRVIGWLIEGLSEPYPQTRSDVIAWLWRCKAKEAVPKLARLSRDDPSGAIRVAAAHAVAQITGEKKRAIQVMTTRLRGETYCGQWEAAQLLGEYEDLPEITIKALKSKVKTVKGPYRTLEKYEDNRISSTAKRTLEKVSAGKK